MSTITTSRRRLVLAALPLALLLAACGAEATSTSDLIADDPTLDEGDIGGHDETVEPAGAAAGMCPAGTTDCVDADLGEAGDPIVAEDIHQVDALPADIRMVEMAPGAAEEPWRMFIQEAVVDGTRVDLVFSGGEAPCFFVDSVEVIESDTEVIVDLLAGGAGTDDCAGQATSIQGVTVELDAPLGDRALLDGSRTVR